jgi:hypothetical protein
VILVYDSVVVPKVSCSRFIVVSLIRIILVLFLNRIQAMVPLTAPLFGVLFLRGHISLKNWT